MTSASAAQHEIDRATSRASQALKRTPGRGKRTVIGRRRRSDGQHRSPMRVRTVSAPRREAQIENTSFIDANRSKTSPLCQPALALGNQVITDRNIRDGATYPIAC